MPSQGLSKLPIQFQPGDTNEERTQKLNRLAQLLVSAVDAINNAAAAASAAASSSVTFANPTGLVELTETAGVLKTAMRSDAAPALDQSITPVWTGEHTWSFPGGGTAGPIAIDLTNPEAASTFVQQFSPRMKWTGQGWNGVLSNTRAFAAGSRPVGTNGVIWVLSAQIGSAGLADVFIVDQNGNITTATWEGNTVEAPYGGTGQDEYVVGDILFASAVEELARLAAPTDNNLNVLTSKSIAGAPQPPAYLDVSLLPINWDQIVNPPPIPFGLEDTSMEDFPVIPGPAGAPGAAGAAGAVGPPGVQGEDGADGDPGPPGVAGPTGATGATGAQGPQGPVVAMLAEDGHDGDDGRPGLTGATGATGPQGSQGPVGAAIAMLADDGQDGDQGQPGATGATGATGSAGSPGAQGPVGAVVAMLADDGIDGDQGQPGPTGSTGATGSTGSAGPQGPAGPVVAMLADDGQDGDQGQPGATGPAGATGATGSTGAQGPMGAVVALLADDGQDGDQGPIGPTGATGPQGSTGPAGPTGAQGPIGPAAWLVADDAYSEDTVGTTPPPPGALTGTFTATMTGMTGTVTGTVHYVITADRSHCSLYTTAAITGTSNSTAMTMTGLPTVCQPANQQNVITPSLEDNSVTTNVFGIAEVNTSAGTITFILGGCDTSSPFYIGGSAGGTASFTASGTKGLLARWGISYPLL